MIQVETALTMNQGHRYSISGYFSISLCLKRSYYTFSSNSHSPISSAVHQAGSTISSTCIESNGS